MERKSDLLKEPYVDPLEELEEIAGSPRPQDPKNEALALPMNAEALVVRDQATYDVARAYLKDVKRLQTEIAATFDPHIKAADKTHKDLLAEKRRFTAPLERAEGILKPKVARYLYDLDQARQEAARAQALAKAKAELEAEATVAAAHTLIESGQPEKADVVVQAGYAKVQEIQAAAPEMPEAPTDDDIRKRTTWDFEVVNEAELPREYLKPDLVRIGQVVRALKDQAKIAGVRTFARQNVSVKIG